MSGPTPTLSIWEGNLKRHYAIVYLRGKHAHLAIREVWERMGLLNNVIKQNDCWIVYFNTANIASAIQERLMTWHLVCPEWWDEGGITPYSENQWETRKRIINKIRFPFRTQPHAPYWLKKALDHVEFYKDAEERVQARSVCNITGEA